MNEVIIEFFIYKYSYKTNQKIDLSFLPMMILRKLSNLDKIAFATLYECYEKDNTSLVFASQHGEFDKLVRLINQYKKENATSPTLFSTSVHNSAISTFSILNKIDLPYNAVSAGDNSLSHGLLESVLNAQNNNVLFCYADALETPKSVSCLLSRTPRENAIKISLINKPNNNCAKSEFEFFIKFLKGDLNKFETDMYIIERMAK